MNETIDQMLQHKSIRKFKTNPVETEKLDAILAAAQMASSSSNMQALSVIRITDLPLRRKIAELAGNYSYVESAPEFLVWCADLYRLETVLKLHGKETEACLDTVENFLVATVDTALAAQNAAVAAESLGLGIVYIGGIRESIGEIAELLELPRLVYPVFGMCIGYPDQQPVPRPRLPRSTVLHENRYSEAGYREGIQAYDERMKQYMLERSGGKSALVWSESMAAKLSKPNRKHMQSFLQERGFLQE